MHFAARIHSIGSAWSCCAPTWRIAFQSARAIKVVEAVLGGASGIETRHFAVPPDEIFAAGSRRALNRAFEVEAPVLAEEALMRASERDGSRPEEIDALLCLYPHGLPVSRRLQPSCRTREAAAYAFPHDLSGLGCGAALLMMRCGLLFSRRPSGRSWVATVAVEVCSGGFLHR